MNELAPYHSSLLKVGVLWPPRLLRRKPVVLEAHNPHRGSLGDGRLGAVGVDGAVAPQSLGRQGSRNQKNFRGVGGRGRSHGTCGVLDLRNKMRGVPDGYVEGVGYNLEEEGYDQPA